MAMYEDRIHGDEVKARAETDRTKDGKPITVVLIYRGSGYQPWVTAMHVPGEREWWSGHYFTSSIAARQDFTERVQKGY